MNPETIIAECNRRGLALSVVDGCIRIEGPESLATDGLIDLIRSNKVNIAVRLSGGVVHITPGIGPYDAQGGPGEWTSPDGSKPLEIREDGERARLSIESGPHGPPFHTNRYSLRRTHSFAVSGGFRGVNVFDYCNPVSLTRPSGPSGPSGPLDKRAPWECLATLRWGPGDLSERPGLIVDRPDRSRMLAAVRAIQPMPGEPDRGDAREDEPLPWE